MDIDRLPDVGRRGFMLGLLGAAAVVSGCGDDASVPPPSADTAAKEKERQDAERAAREKAFGKGGAPKTTGKK